MKLAFIAGTSLLGSGFFQHAINKTVKIHGSNIEILSEKKRLFLPRHGLNLHLPPHKLNHAANLSALKKLGADMAIAVCSVGSLKRRITPAHYLVPDDFIGLWSCATVFDKGPRHITPGLDDNLRNTIIRCVKKLQLPLKTSGVYFQTTGPRLETKAEIRFLAKFADVVGMTMASEATVAKELELPYAALCVVDNFANGVAATPLTLKQIKDSATTKWPVIMRVLESIAKELLCKTLPS